MPRRCRHGSPPGRNCCVWTLDAEAAQLIADRVEGNLLAAKQELEKLSLLADGGTIGADLVLRSVGDSARYDVFQLAQAAAAGDAARAFHVLLGLKSEGVEPTLILWALLREVRGLWQAFERDRLHSVESRQRLEPRGHAVGRARCRG